MLSFGQEMSLNKYPKDLKNETKKKRKERRNLKEAKRMGVHEE